MSTTRLMFRRGAWIPAAMLSTLAACGDGAGSSNPLTTDGGVASLSVSFANNGVSAAVATNAAGNAVLVGTASDTMVISKVQLVLGNVKLRRSGIAACPDSIKPSTTSGRSSDDRGCSRLDLGPVLLDLPLGGTSTSPLSVTVPAGTYGEMEFEIDDVRSDSRATPAESAFLTAHPEFRNTTIRVNGTYKGAAFTFTSRAEAEVEFEFSPALDVKAGVNDNITIALDLSKWFKNASGAILPATVANQVAIDQNITASFSAFGDRDRDGREDGGDRPRESGRRRGGNG
jgi:hypothetical protein